MDHRATLTLTRLHEPDALISEVVSAQSPFQVLRPALLVMVLGFVWFLQIEFSPLHYLIATIALMWVLNTLRRHTPKLSGPVMSGLTFNDGPQSQAGS